MTLDWVRQEILKDQDKIDWMGIINASKVLYKEINENKNFLGLSKGFVNIIRTSHFSKFNRVEEELNSIYNPDDMIIIKAGLQSILTNIVKSDSTINDYTLSNKIIIVITDKSTIESVLVKRNIPFLNFSMSLNTTRTEESMHLPTPTYITMCSWRRRGEKSITWIKGQAISIKRDGILDELLK